MRNRTFRVKSSICKECKDCIITNIPRNDIYQSLANAKLYVYLNKSDCGGMEEVEEEI